LIVLDTHALVWWHLAPDKLGRAGRRACERADAVGVSAITFWEIGALASRGRIRLRVPLADWVRTVLAGPRMHGLPVTPEIAVIAASLGLHGDPADRLIVATALHHAARLVTYDESITRARIVDTLWD
jgi:PIN domain nuclease of toxin-antitoxin system